MAVGKRSPATVNLSVDDILEFEDRTIDELLDHAREGHLAADAYELIRVVLRDHRDKLYREFLNAPPQPEVLIRYWAQLRGIEILAQTLLTKAARGKRARDILLASSAPAAGSEAEG